MDSMHVHSFLYIWYTDFTSVSMAGPSRKLWSLSTWSLERFRGNSPATQKSMIIIIEPSLTKKITVRQNYTNAADQLVHVYSYNNDIHLQIFAHTAGIQLTLAIYKHLEPR